ncbi:MAG: ATPase, partial [Mycobacterium sp.]
MVAVRGDRLALTRFEIGTADTSPGAPQEELLHLFGLDNDGRIALFVVFDIEDLDAAIAELDAVHARFQQERSQTRRLENAATRADDRVNELFADRRWDEINALLADDVRVDDRSRGLHREGADHATELANARAIADIGVKNITSRVLALRGERLALTRTVFSGRDQRPDAFHTEMLRIAEIGTDQRIVAYVAFDLDDFDAAIAELDARYLAGEATAYAQTWSAVAAAYAAFNRRELGATTPEWVNIDHRRGAGFAPGDMIAYIQAAWDDSPDTNKIYVGAVHRLSKIGAVVAIQAHGISEQGFDAEWRDVHLLAVEGDMLSRCELFDEDDLDAAIARFEQLGQPGQRLENAASRVFENEWLHFAARDWDALAELVADNYSGIDHRRVVRAENQHGRDVVVKDLQAAADVGFTISMVSAIAIRGERLVLARVRASGPDPKAIQNDALNVIEIDADERILAAVTFDLEDFDAAMAELESRYLVGEAAAYAHTWSVVAAGYAGFNRRELLATTPDWVSIDHRRGAGFAPGDMIAYIQAAWDDSPDTKIYIGAVHRLSEIGAVVTHLARGISEEGFDAEWRDVNVLAVEGDIFSRSELFDEADLDTAIARFDQLCGPAPRLENAASHVYERFQAYFAARDWAALADIPADDCYSDDRRRVVNGGVIGRGAVIESFRSGADLGLTHATSDTIATRGGRLVLTRDRYWRGDQNPEALSLDLLQIVEIDAEERILAFVTFDADDFEAAIAELDARYLAGEAAAHSRTWSVIMQGYASLNRRELPTTTPDWVNIDHRRGTSIAPGGIPELLTAAWNVTSDLNNFVEAVHRLDNLGGVVTHVANETSQEGFHAEWRVVSVFTVERDMVNRCEVFDEAAIDTAIARFDQLCGPAPRLENTASRTNARLIGYANARDWDSAASILADDHYSDDRRRVTGAGIRRGRDADIENFRVVADLGAHITVEVIATRGDRLILTRNRAEIGEKQQPFTAEFLGVVETNLAGRIEAVVELDLEDFDAAIAELDARYLAGEAAAHAHTWSVIAGAYAAFNRHELPAADWVTVDNRRATPFASSTMTASLRAMWDLTQDLNIHIETVYRLNAFGAVVCHTGSGTSPEGFDAEWRAIDILTVEGDRITRCEVFDEDELDTAVARFEELSPTPRLENAASRLADRFVTHLIAGDWDALAEMLADDFTNDDRRRVVGSGVINRDVQLVNTHAIVELWSNDVKSSTIATRGERLVLVRLQLSDADQESEAFLVEVLGILEIGPEDRMTAFVTLDVDDFDAAIAELDARYLAGEAAANERTWSVISGSYAAINRNEMPLTTPDCVNIDRRRELAMGVGDLIAYISAVPDRDQDSKVYVEAVHRLTERGAVVTYAAHGTSQEGFDAEWRGIAVLTVDGELVDRTEIFDEAYLDAALARFDQLSRPAPRPENTATRVFERLYSYIAAGDWHAVAQISAENVCVDDRRRVVNAGILHGRDANIKDAKATVDVGFTMTMLDVLATRGDRLALTRIRVSGPDPEAIENDALQIMEIDVQERIAGVVVFDRDDFDAAIPELDARYLAGEAAAHARTWTVISSVFAALSRRELPSTTTDFVDIDHRKGTAFAPGELMQYLRAGWDINQEVRPYVEAVHRLNSLGAVITHSAQLTSRQGFEAEWRTIDIMTVDGDLLNRSELFDDADLDAALARFDRLSRPAPHLENAAAQAYERIQTHFAARDWDGLAKALADDVFRDDRRRVVGAELRKGRGPLVAEFSALAEIGVKRLSFDTIAIRGSRLLLSRSRASGRDPRADAFRTDVLTIIELDAVDRIAAIVTLDPDDFDAAVAALDARYLAGEAAPHSAVFSAVMQGFVALNRHERPRMTPDVVSVDHRRGRAFVPGDLPAFLDATWELMPQASFYIEDVHRLNGIGVVVAYVVHGTTKEGSGAEWRQIAVLKIAGDCVSRCEFFDEEDLDGAIASFDELHPPALRLENAASQVTERFQAHFAVRDWAAMGEILADGFSSDDRRRVVGAGVRDGRHAEIADMAATADLGITHVTSTVVATRGGRLTLMRGSFMNRDQGPEPFLSEALGVVEINAYERIVAFVTFDLDDIDAAFEELDARYLAGEAAAYTHTWSRIAEAFAAINRHELPELTPDWVNVDHRRGAAFAAGEMTAYLRDLL